MWISVTVSNRQDLTENSSHLSSTHQHSSRFTLLKIDVCWSIYRCLLPAIPFLGAFNVQETFISLAIKECVSSRFAIRESLLLLLVI